MNLVQELLGLVDALNAAGVDYALCGGVALAIHGHPRYTKDIDLLVLPSDLERVRAAARGAGFTLAGSDLTFAANTPGQRELSRLTKAEGTEFVTLDLLHVGPVYSRVWESRRHVEWEGRVVWVVSREGLIEMKRLAGRLQDLADVERLLAPEEGPPDG